MLAAHAIFGAYGFWLPNDPRGSWSDFVGSCELYRHGCATKTNERRSLAYDSHDRQARLAAKADLQRPAVHFNEAQTNAVASGVEAYIRRSGLIVWACAILPDHTHLVIAASPVKIEQRINLVKGSATAELRRLGVHPFERLAEIDGSVPKCFAQGEWKVYLDTPADVARAVAYVEANPEKDGLPRQYWPFVTDWRAQIERVVPFREGRR